MSRTRRGLGLAAAAIGIAAALDAGYAAGGPAGLIDAAAVAGVGVLVVARGTVPGRETGARSAQRSAKGPDAGGPCGGFPCLPHDRLRPGVGAAVAAALPARPAPAADPAGRDAGPAGGGASGSSRRAPGTPTAPAPTWPRWTASSPGWRNGDRGAAGDGRGHRAAGRAGPGRSRAGHRGQAGRHQDGAARRARRRPHPDRGPARPGQDAAGPHVRDGARPGVHPGPVHPRHAARRPDRRHRARTWPPGIRCSGPARSSPACCWPTRSTGPRPRPRRPCSRPWPKGQVSADGVTRPLPSPFVVLATDNPIEYEGTYPLPEAQLDRFIARVRLGYLDAEGEAEMVRRRLARGSAAPAPRAGHRRRPAAGHAGVAGAGAAAPGPAERTWSRWSPRPGPTRRSRWAPRRAARWR